jgi:spermidine/putrescine transport system substrate-binding protein
MTDYRRHGYYPIDRLRPVTGPLKERPISRRSLLAGAGALGAGMVLAACGDDDDAEPAASGGGGDGAESIEGTTVNLLAWPGHGDKYLVGPFEQKTGAKVRIKEYQDGEEALALYNQSPPGTYDVIMTEPTDLERFITSGGLEPLDPAEFPAADTDMLEQYQTNNAEWKDRLGGWFDGEWYAAPWSYMVQGTSYNSDHLTEDDMSSHAILWDPKTNGRVGWSHYWLNAMSTIAQYYGHTQNWWEPFEYAPLEIPKDRFDEMKAWLFEQPTENVRGFYGVGDTTQSLAQGETWCTPGAGISSSASLTLEGGPITTKVPEEGVPQYSESLSMGVGSKNPEGAKEFIRYCISPEGCARKATMPAYQGIPTSLKSWEWIAENQPEWVPVLQIDPDGPNVQDSWEAGVVSIRTLPENVEEWVDTWEEYKNAI